MPHVIGVLIYASFFWIVGICQAFCYFSLENWYYRILLLMMGFLKNATIAVDASAVCLSISGLEFMIPIAFLAATGVRVANELGAGNGNAAKFSTQVSVVQSLT